MKTGTTKATVGTNRPITLPCAHRPIEEMRRVCYQSVPGVVNSRFQD